MMQIGEYILHEGRTAPIVAKVRQNGVKFLVLIHRAHAVRVLEKDAIVAPKRSTPKLVWVRP